jgi:hypothetical protein
MDEEGKNQNPTIIFEKVEKSVSSYFGNKNG